MKTIGLILLGVCFLACQTPTGATNGNPTAISRAPAPKEIPASPIMPPKGTSNAASAANASNSAPTILAPADLAPAGTVALPPPISRSELGATLTTGPDLAPQGTIAPDEVFSPGSQGANVTNITVGGGPGNYNFSVTVQSPDTGCDQYADWWEVLSPEGVLIHRRVLLHSHGGEQPFTRSGGPIRIGADQPVIVRAHMNTTGYDGTAFAGSPTRGFGPATLEPDFASQVETEPPLPSSCAG